jgi:hypothetical protein
MSPSLQNQLVNAHIDQLHRAAVAFNQKRELPLAATPIGRARRACRAAGRARSSASSSAAAERTRKCRRSAAWSSPVADPGDA